MVLAAVFFAQALGPVRAAVLQVSPSIEEAARGLGAGPGRTMRRITAPLVRRGLVTGCGCGCRGDFEITAKGIQWLAQVDSKLSIRPTQNRGDGVSADPKKEE